MHCKYWGFKDTTQCKYWGFKDTTQCKYWGFKDTIQCKYQRYAKTFSCHTSHPPSVEVGVVTITIWPKNTRGAPRILMPHNVFYARLDRVQVRGCGRPHSVIFPFPCEMETLFGLILCLVYFGLEAAVNPTKAWIGSPPILLYEMRLFVAIQ